MRPPRPRSPRESRTLEMPHRIEAAVVGEITPDRPTVVMLHHGLGSLSTWRDLPETIADATDLPVAVYSRRGYGGSAPTETLPWPPDFMHREAEGDLPRLLDALDVRHPLLLGHSDGASIALVHAASRLEPAPIGAILLAPHVFVEEVTLEGARRAMREFRSGALRAALAPHHDDPESAFRGWSETWLSARFRDWDLAPSLGSVRCPLLVIQGLADEYGTVAQVRPIRERAPGPVETLLLDGCGHAPERERPVETLDSIVAFAAELTGTTDDLAPGRIHHLVPAERLRAGLRDDHYHAAHLAAEGFTHCTLSPATTLAVADDLFPGEPPVVLRIETGRLDAEVRMEPPAPVPGGMTHRRFASRFPHVYGPIARDAIAGEALLASTPDGYAWPSEFGSPSRGRR